MKKRTKVVLGDTLLLSELSVDSNGNAEASEPQKYLIDDNIAKRTDVVGLEVGQVFFLKVGEQELLLRIEEIC